MLQYLKQFIHVAQNDGLRTAIGKVRRRIAVGREKRQYDEWCRRYSDLRPGDVARALENFDKFSSKPVISVLMPVYDVDERWLRRAIDSVRAQIYENWELCIADDHSSQPHVGPILREYAASDPRIKVSFRKENGHISAASNTALELVTGDFVALMDHDDELTPEALYFVAKWIDLYPNADIIYSNEDKIDERGRRFDPFFKPDWSPDLFYSVNYLAHLIVYRTSLIRGAGGFRTRYDGSQDYDLALRAIEKTRSENIVHIPKVLYHWRAISGSVALASEEKPYAHERARQAINEHFDRTAVKARSVRGVGELHRVIYNVPQPPPKVGVIVSGAGNENGIEKRLKLEHTSYPFELIMADGDDTLSRFERLNQAAGRTTGEILCFIDGATISVSDKWLDELAGHVWQKATGVVGGMILYPTKRIKHAGYILGLKNGIGSPNRNALASPGMDRRLDMAQNYSAVSIHCMAIKKEVFDEAAGFDVADFPDYYGDVDLCLRLLELGYRNVWTPWAEIVQTESTVPEHIVEIGNLRQRWTAFFECDPYYDPNLTLENEDLTLAQPPRIDKV